MKFKVNDSCIGCGLCNGICPKVFSMNDEGLAAAIEEDIDQETIDKAIEAMESCPMQAIENDEEEQ